MYAFDKRFSQVWRRSVDYQLSNSQSLDRAEPVSLPALENANLESASHKNERGREFKEKIFNKTFQKRFTLEPEWR